MNVDVSPQDALWIKLVKFEYMTYDFQQHILKILEVMNNDELSVRAKAQELAEYSEYLDEIDRLTLVDYVLSYSRFSSKKWVI